MDLSWSGPRFSERGPAVSNVMGGIVPKGSRDGNRIDPPLFEKGSTQSNTRFQITSTTMLSDNVLPFQNLKMKTACSTPCPGFKFVLFISMSLMVGLDPLLADDWNLDPSIKPDDNRFTPTVVLQGPLNEPMAFEVLEDGRIFLIERRRHPDDRSGGWSAKPVGALEVNTEGNNEQGLVGMTLDLSSWKTGGCLYYFSPEEPKAIISRWTLKNNVLVANSEKVLLSFEAQRETCCHTGGGMAWDSEGNLFMPLGTTRVTTKHHTDERPGRSGWDDQRGTADSLEGKILRIHLKPTGPIPSLENLFPYFVHVPKSIPWAIAMLGEFLSTAKQDGFTGGSRSGRAKTRSWPQGR